MKKYIFPFVLAAAIASPSLCLPAESKKGAKWSAALETWVGKDINEFIGRMGPPQSEYRMPNGNGIYTWRQASTYTDPVQISPNVAGGYTASGGDTVIYACNTSITTNKAGVILDWKWDGNNC